ncbi:MAG: hypothetical protein HQ513_12500 [Rhodospirillales bacterium]|nr:hypothetical protein [Rhodospirillales bacterium]
MIILRLPFLFVASFVFSLTFSATADAGTDCPEIPAVAWWGDTSPEGITAYVDRKHDGDWAPYLKKWQKYEKRMRDILSNGKSAVVKSQDITLEGEELAKHIELIAKRVEAIDCIAARVTEARLSEDLNNMDTAAGGNPEPDSKLQSDGSCSEFTKVVWWETSHEKVASYVVSKHDGDWKAYVEKWSKQLEKMISLSDRGGAAVFKSKNLKLEGEVLLQYIEAVKDRLAVTKCLAHREMVNSGEKKNAAANDG